MNIKNNLFKSFLLMVTATSLAEQQPKPVPYVSIREIPSNPKQLPQFLDTHFLKNGTIIKPLESMYQKNCTGNRGALPKNQESCKQFNLFFEMLQNVEQDLYTRKVQLIYNDRNLSDQEKQSLIAQQVNGYIQFFNTIFYEFNTAIKNTDDWETGSKFIQNLTAPYARTKSTRQPKQLTFFGQPLFRKR